MLNSRHRAPRGARGRVVGYLPHSAARFFISSSGFSGIGQIRISESCPAVANCRPDGEKVTVRIVSGCAAWDDRACNVVASQIFKIPSRHALANSVPSGETAKALMACRCADMHVFCSQVSTLHNPSFPSVSATNNARSSKENATAKTPTIGMLATRSPVSGSQITAPSQPQVASHLPERDSATHSIDDEWETQLRSIRAFFRSQSQILPPEPDMASRLPSGEIAQQKRGLPHWDSWVPSGGLLNDHSLRLPSSLTE